jgi:hypothetical protein
MSSKKSKCVINTGQYRKCFNHQILEMPSTLSTISGTVTVKVISRTEYHISSANGSVEKITLLAIKLWDLILLKLTEVVPGHRHKNYEWNYREGWHIDLSIKTIADCLGLSTRVDLVGRRIVKKKTAAKTLENISVTITKSKNSTKIDGYLSKVYARDCSDTQEHYMAKSNALFTFTINPELIAYLAEQKVGIYYFNHCWLHLPENSQNAYVAAKRMGRHYSQNTYKRKNSNKPVTMDIGTLRNSLPCLKNKVDKDNRLALDNALKSIPGLTYSYLIDGQELTFDELAKRQLHTGTYNKVRIDIKYGDHPNTSDNKTTTDCIKKMVL